MTLSIIIMNLPSFCSHVLTRHHLPTAARCYCVVCERRSWKDDELHLLLKRHTRTAIVLTCGS